MAIGIINWAGINRPNEGSRTVRPRSLRIGANPISLDQIHRIVLSHLERLASSTFHSP